MRGDLSIPLAPDFRFAHEPGGTFASNVARPAVGRASEVDEFVSRILYSDGGALLLAGYRGVGKTTFVNEVVRTLRGRLIGRDPAQSRVELLDVSLSFARPMSATELMHHVLRGLHERLRETGALLCLPEELRETLQLAFLRTSMQVALKSSDGTISSLKLDAKSALPLLGFEPTWSVGTQRSRSLAREVAYLGYDENAAESDLVRIARRLTLGYTLKQRLSRFLPAVLSRAPVQVGLKILFIFDELDKIETSGPDDPSPLDSILRSLKTLLTTSGIHFIFVAGRELYDRWLADVGQGDSIYESVFAHVKYLNALWTHVDSICDPLVDAAVLDNAAAESPRLAYQSFKRFLAFKGRGIPRRILRGFNEAVRIEAGAVSLRVTPEDRRRYQFYAGLFELLQSAEQRLFAERAAERDPELVDRQRLGLYYVVDWILGRGAVAFTGQQAIQESRRLSRSVALAEDIAPLIVNALVALFEENGYLERVSDRTMVFKDLDQEPGAVPVWYRVPRARLIEFGRIDSPPGAAQSFFDREVAAIQATPKPPVSERYDRLELIGQGGFAAVYRATDRTNGRQVAIKQLHAELVDPVFRARFAQEVAILGRMRHPGVVRLLEADATAERPYLVMEFVAGVPLSKLRVGQTALDWPTVVAIADGLLQAIEYVHSLGILWRDVKPSNIFVSESGRIVIIDFGISKPQSSEIDALTQTGQVIGTARFLSPEQIRGTVIDQRSDLFAVGTILYELVTGRTPWEGQHVSAILYGILNEAVRSPSETAVIPDALTSMILRCLAKNPGDRFASAREAREALPSQSGAVDLPRLVRAAQERLSRSAGGEEITRGTDPVEAKAAEPEMTAAVDIEVTPPTPVPHAPVSASTIQDSRLVLKRPGLTDLVFPLDQAEMTIGRGSDNYIVLHEASVSRFHARVRRVGPQFFIEDLNSANGVLVNGAPIQESVPLADGAAVQIGALRMEFSAGGPAANESAIAPPPV